MVQARSGTFVGWAFEGNVKFSSKDGSFSLLKDGCVSIQRVGMKISIQVVPQIIILSCVVMMQDFYFRKQGRI